MRYRMAAQAMALMVLANLVCSAGAAELVILEQSGCAWCARFNAEIAPAYATHRGRTNSAVASRGYK